MKFGEIFWGEVKIDALKWGEGYKQKGNDNSICRRQIVKSTFFFTKEK